MESNREEADHPNDEHRGQQKKHHQRSSSCTQHQAGKQQQELIADFSGMFKRKGSWAVKKAKNKDAETKPANWLLQIPTKLDITLEDLKTRRVMDERRWMSVAKASQTSMKVIAAVCTCWNYLLSSKGVGSNQYLSVNACLQILSPSISITQIQAATQFDRIELISKVIECLNAKGNEQLMSSVCVKLSPPLQLQTSPATQKTNLLEGLSSAKCAYIYLAYKDVFCPIGYDITPLKQIQAYQKLERINEEDQELWIINSCVGRNEPSFCIKRWSDVQKDLETVWPQFLDIKEVKQGVQVRAEVTDKNKQEKRGTSNCIIQVSFK